MSVFSFPENKRQSGRTGEDMALAYLLEQGLTLVERNFSTRMGEIDLIMKEGDTLVFVEVRRRSRSDFGDALASIGRAKQQRLVKAAHLFLQKTGQIPACRFDAVALDKNKITWLKNMMDEM